MNVFLRVDSSLSIGSGHVIRCLNLAKALEKQSLQCIFVTKSHRGNIIKKIKKDGFQTKIIDSDPEFDSYTRDEKAWLNGSQEDDARDFIALVMQECDAPAIIIVDHYSLDSEWENLVKKSFPETRLVVIDDLCNRPHRCDLLIDQTFQREVAEYTSLNESQGTILTGTKFALLSPTFSGLRELSITRKAQLNLPKTLLLTMGGVDAHNITGKVLSSLEECSFNYIDKITVILGAACPHQHAIHALAGKLKYKIEVLTNVTNMAELMYKHDFAIGAMGGTTWERCVMALPAINVAIADNQLTIASNLESVGAIVMHADEIDKVTINTALNALTIGYHDQRVLAMSICDGQGLTRVIQEIIFLPAKDGKNVSLRKATVDDIEFVYQLQCEPKTREFARNPNVPIFEEHINWMKRKLSDDSSYFYIIEHHSSCGVLRLDPVVHKYAEFEISIFLTTDAHGKGIASAAIKRATMQHCDVNLLATVLPENRASHQLFERLGFVKLSSSEYISEKKQ